MDNLNGYLKFKRVFGGIIRTLFRIHAHGVENEPESGGLLVCANHTSLFDVFVLGAVLKRPMHFMAKAELFRIPVLRRIVKALGAYPVDRGGADVSAIKKTLRYLENGDVVGLFPQGHRNKRVYPGDTEVKPGVGMIAHHSGVQVLPVFISTKNYAMRLFGRKDVYVGVPVTREELEFSAGGMQEYKKATETVFGRILELDPMRPAEKG